MRFLLSCRALRHPDAALLLMIQLTQLQWWFLHQDLLKHLKQIPPPPSPPRNKLPGWPPSCFSWMPLWPQLDLTHDSNQSCLQLRSECSQDRREIGGVLEKPKASWASSHVEGLWDWHAAFGVGGSGGGGGGWLPLLREVVRDSSGFGL